MSGFGSDVYAVFRAYRDVLVRIGDQGENFDRSEAVDVMSRIVESGDVTNDQRLDMLKTLIRAAADMELDDDAEREIALTDEYLKE